LPPFFVFAGASTTSLIGFPSRSKLAFKYLLHTLLIYLAPLYLVIVPDKATFGYDGMKGEAMDTITEE
jgi:hypothetical protein